MSNNETMNVKRENLLNAYKNANDEQKAFLENLFGTETFTPKDIRERIKTFADALHELGNENPLVLAYQNTNLRDSDVASNNKDIIAYLKLRIIVAALNEGWEPQFIPGECRWAPYFVLYTKEEIDEMDEETKARVVFRSGNYASAYGGASCASAAAHYDAANVHASIGSRLAFKSEELAEYAGTQFIDIFADFMLGWELKK